MICDQLIHFLRVGSHQSIDLGLILEDQFLVLSIMLLLKSNQVTLEFLTLSVSTRYELGNTLLMRYFHIVETSQVVCLHGFKLSLRVVLQVCDALLA